jgi:hypothetical protein
MLHVRSILDASQQITDVRANNKKRGGRLGWLFRTGDHPMVLISSYLAVTAQRRAIRATLSGTRTAFGRLLAVIAASGQALSDAQEMRRTMTQKYPFTDI